MFKFGFGEADEGSAQPDSQALSSKDLLAAREIKFGESSKLRSFQLIQVGKGVALLKSNLGSEEAAQLLGDVACGDSDLVPGKYEGGFKVWEGAMDLTQYLLLHEPELQQQLATPKSDAGPFAGVNVLELGCGHGLPGLFMLSRGAAVDFQDYNPEVLTELTGPNVLANWDAWLLRGSVAPHAKTAPVRLFSGDWGSLADLLREGGRQGSYDLILTAETIYNLESVPSLLNCIKTALRPGGIALVAAKVYYFGVGGSTQAFRKAVAAEGDLKMTQTLAVEGGQASIQREIMVVTRV